MRPPRLRLQRSTWIAAFVVPIGLAALAGALLAREPVAIVAPLLGPWAGHLLGHGECTFAAVATRATVALCILGAAGFLGWRRATDDAVRETFAALLVLWSCAWLATGVLSVLNTTS
jgi:hypothetical protein